MSDWNAPLHVYAREISQEERTSLSVLASLVRPGATVLDLGCGSGALGRFLKEHAQCTLDGVTLNEAEAELARPFYRRVEVANLDHCDLPALFAGQRYDHIICADVLEHLRAPEQTLAACRQLLNAQGDVLISIPNAAYAGLIAELMLGEFTYREEGLLDNTHLRFFTRQSLLQFLQAQGWGLQTLDTVQRPLLASEFKVNFDQLPPAVARYLLALPDAETYQFIGRARPDLPHAELANPVSPRGQALFTAQLFLGGDDGYQEDRKLEVGGVIGDLRQTVRFDLPASPGFRSLKFDLADRPGFLHLYAMTLRQASGQILWRWSAQADGLYALARLRHSGMLVHGETTDHQAALVLLTDDDPWLELPPQAQAQGAHGGSLEVDLGWPMSADFLALSQTVGQLQTRLQMLQQAHQQGQQRTAEDSRNAWRVMREQHRVLVAHKKHIDDEHRVLRQHYDNLRKDANDVIAHREILLQQLHALENSRAIRMTRPLVAWKVRWKTRLDALLRRGPAANAVASPEPLAHAEAVPQAALALTPVTAPAPAPAPAPAQAPALAGTVDVIVPVYRGLADTQRCLHSVLASEQKTPWHLIIVNDCSPEPEVTAWLREFANQDSRITLLENPHNLGFVASVNRGMSVSAERDVVLLNSDAEVANDWLDRLARAARDHGKVGTVTPFSNNATICSYPAFCQANLMPAGYDTASLDALFARTNPGAVLDVPTGIGFCMYIRRDCLAEVGLFDVVSFGTGYGEENDFCQRAAAAGWRNLHALDTFVRHAGGVSFGASKSDRELAAMDMLRVLHPGYERQVQDFVAADPARSYRLRVDAARLRELQQPIVLMVLHDLGGGTLRHVEELARHIRTQALSLFLVPGARGEVRLQWPDPHETFELSFRCPEDLDHLADLLRGIGVQHIHFHHLLGQPPSVMTLPSRLGVTYDFTAHDYHAVCPQVSLAPPPAHTYCGEQGLDQCRACLARKPAPTGESIESWRTRHGEFLQQARFVLAPSRDAARRLARYVPGANLRFAPHTDLALAPRLPQPIPFPVTHHGALRILVVGALSPIKGADMLEAVALEAARTQSPLEFHLVGYPYRALQGQPHASLVVHGRYAEEELGLLLQRLRPDIVWFPAQWPETYSYTLSACLLAGTPIVAPQLGAFAERLSSRAWTWLEPWETTPAQWVAFFNRLRSQHFIPGDPPPLAPDYPLSAQELQMGGWSYDVDYVPKRPGRTDAAELALNLINAHLPRNPEAEEDLTETASA